MKLEFRIAQRKKNTKSKYTIAISDVEVKLKGNKELIDTVYKDIVKNVIDKDKIIY